MKTLSVSEATTTVTELVEKAKKEPILLRERNGRTFVLLEVDDADAEAWSLGTSADFQQVIERSRARARREGWLTTAQVRKQLGITKRRAAKGRPARQKRT